MNADHAPFDDDHETALEAYERTRQQAEAECSIGRLGWALVVLVALIWLSCIN